MILRVVGKAWLSGLTGRRKSLKKSSESQENNWKSPFEKIKQQVSQEKHKIKGRFKMSKVIDQEQDGNSKDVRRVLCGCTAVCGLKKLSFVLSKVMFDATWRHSKKCFLLAVKNF